MTAAYWAALAGAMVLLSACRDTTLPRTQVVVLIDAEGGTQARADALRIELAVQTGDAFVPRPPARLYEGAALRWPVRFSLVPADPDTAPGFELLARVLQGDHVLSQVHVRGEMIRREVRLLRIVLGDACLDARCESSCHVSEGVAECGILEPELEPIGELCDGELCDAPDSICLDPRPCGCGLATHCPPDAGADATLPDAGADAAPPDAGADAAPPDAGPPDCKLEIVAADGSPALSEVTAPAAFELLAVCENAAASLPADLRWSLEGPGYLCPPQGCGEDDPPALARGGDRTRYVPVAPATSNADARLRVEGSGATAARHGISVGSPFPSLLPDLSLWLDADDPATVTQESGELAWADKSPFGLRATAAPTSAQRDAAGWNGRGQVRVTQDGGGLTVADHAALRVGASAARPLSAIIVYRQPSVSAAPAALLAKASSEPEAADYALTLERGLLTFATAASGSCEIARVLAPLPTQPHDVVAISDPATATTGIKRLFADGEALALADAQAACGYGAKSTDGSAPLRLGRAEGQFGHVALELAEVLMFRRALADDERRAVEAYVEAKWGLGACADDGLPERGVAMRGELELVEGIAGWTNGGNAESGDLCPPGSWLVGLTGPFVTSGWHDGATAICATPEPGLDRCHPGQVLTTHRLRQTGGLHGRWWTACPPGSVVTGVGGAARGFVDRVTLQCTPYRLRDEGVELSTDAAFSLDPSYDFGVAEQPPQSCPAGQVARGALLRSYAHTSTAGLERVGLLCDRPRGLCDPAIAGDCPSTVSCRSGPNGLAPGALACRGIAEQLDRWDFSGEAPGHRGDAGDGFAVGQNDIDVLRPVCRRARWDDFTLSAWARLDGANDPNTLFSVSDGSNHNTLFLDYRPDTQELRALVLGQVLTATFDAELGRYYHFAVMRRAHKLALAVDGVLISDPEQAPVLSDPLFVDCAQGFVVGQDQDALGGGFQAWQSWFGTIDSVTLRYHGLTDAELMAEVEGRWDFDLRGDAPDESGTPAEAYAVGADTTSWHALPAGLFDGLRDHTFCFRFRAEGVQPGYNHLLSVAIAGTDNEVLVGAGASGTAVYFGGREYALSDDNPLASLAWTDLCTVRQGGLLTAYVDGAPWSSTTVSDVPIRAYGGGVLGVALLGQEQDSVGGSFAANQSAWGVYDHFTLWDRALSAEEIAAQQ